MKCCATFLIPFLACYMAAGSLCDGEEMQGRIRVVLMWAERADGEGEHCRGEVTPRMGTRSRREQDSLTAADSKLYGATSSKNR